MKSLLIFVLALTLPAAVWATDTAPQAEPEGISDVVVDKPPEGLQFVEAAQIDPDELLWISRLLVVFANTENDPAYLQQLALLQERATDLFERDVIVALDTDPSAESALRSRLRPRGFMLAIIDKDGEIKQRKPSPWSAREIVQAIDKFPLRRQEMLDRRPSGR